MSNSGFARVIIVHKMFVVVDTVGADKVPSTPAASRISIL